VRVLVLGGSQGARVLNEVVPPALAPAGLEVEVLHQAGKGNVESVMDRYARRKGIRVEEFVDDMAGAYGWAQLVICRAGALTLAELASAGRPAILVPFPFSAGGHQEVNARAAEARDAAAVILERDLTPEALGRSVADLAGRPARLAAMAASADRSARRDAAKVIVDDLLALASEG
jgi:UDP-N-acetylglucosamine--N-acetylmuramyl-(pentapeptide) pyrophosphoryl-undecaprenol N-acetylglucosamine transferase